MEVIKLSGSNKPYSVSDIIVRSEEEDFILFRVNVSNTKFIPIAKNKPSIGKKSMPSAVRMGLKTLSLQGRFRNGATET